MVPQLRIMKFLKHELAKQFIKFCLVGIFNTVIDFSVYLFLSRAINLYFIFANLLSVLVAMTFSFFANKYFTFQNLEKAKIQYLKFALVNLVYFLLYNSIFWLMVEYYKFDDLLAKVIAIIIGLFWNFGANRYWTFKSSSKPNFK